MKLKREVIFHIFFFCSYVNVADHLEWQESYGNWVLTQDALVQVLGTLNRTKKTVYFPAGQYHSKVL